MNIRRWHAYGGLLIAPSVLFFSLTGAVQLFGLHEGHGNYRPSAIIGQLSSVHKDQVFTRGHHGPPPGAMGPPPSAEAMSPGEIHHDDDDEVSAPTVLLKWYFLIVAIALTGSTAVGVWMGLTQIRGKSIGVTLLVIGTIVPLGLLLL